MKLKTIRLLFVLCVSSILPLFASEGGAGSPSRPSSDVAAAPAELARVDAASEGAKREAQWQQVANVLVQQRTEADAQAREWQMKFALVAQENETLKKQLAAAQQKIAEAPKSESATDPKTQAFVKAMQETTDAYKSEVAHRIAQSTPAKK